MRRHFLLGVMFLVSGCALIAPSGQRFVIFFDALSVDIDKSGGETIAAAAAYARAHPDRAVSVAGFADPIGTAEANAQLTRERTESVVAELVKDGVPIEHIGRREVGEVPFALNSQESRRVTVTIGTP